MAEDHTTPKPAIRNEYQRHGVENFYRDSGATYRNPHEPALRRVLHRLAPDWNLDLSNVLDLAAGSGEVTLALRELGATKIHGIDPYTHAAYESRTGLPATRETFEDIAAGALSGQSYSLIVCSFAMHLLEDSRLAGLAHQLTHLTPHLLILTPHKRPILRPDWGWTLKHETVLHRIRARLYQSQWHPK